MLSILPSRDEDVEALAASEYPAIAASKSGPDFPPSPYLSKTFAAYFSALAVTAPYYKTTGTRNKLEQHFNKALRELNKIDDEKFQLYMASKLKGWYNKFPPAVCRLGAGGGAREDEEGEGEEGDDLDDGYAMAL